jgi:hypothetical protein
MREAKAKLKQLSAKKEKLHRQCGHCAESTASYPSNRKTTRHPCLTVISSK